MKTIALATALFVSVGYAASPTLPDCSHLSPAECNAATRAWGQAVDEHYANQPALPKWSSECRKDRVTLANRCTLTGRKLQVIRTAQLGVCFSGPTNSYPGTLAVIRIGSNEPIRYEGSIVCGQKAVTIISQLMTEQPGAARGNKWPSGIDEFEFDSTGFKQAFNEFEELVKANP